MSAPDVLHGDGLSEDRLTRRLARERAARREAEQIAEQTTAALYDRTRELELLGAVATAANEAMGVEHPVQVALDALAAHIGWQLGHAWLLEQGVPVTLRSAGVWAGGDDPRYAEFRKDTEERTFEPGEGLPGRVLISSAPLWIPDAVRDGNFPRRKVGAPVRGAFAVPMLVGRQSVGVLEFFNDQPAAPDPAILELASQVGTHLGRVIERLGAQERLAHAALHDSLTELPNRALFLDRLELALARCARRETGVGVVFVDLDRFKSINDDGGHQAGDGVLREVARRLTRGLRMEDTVARLGGDEFIVLCEDVEDELEVVNLAQRVHELLSPPVLLAPGDEHAVTASVGIAIGQGGETEPSALLENADDAMHRAKTAGGARTELFNQDMRDRAVGRLRIERALTRALEHDELSLHYQPIVSLDGNAIHGCEALVRWNDPEHGMRSPAEFIPVAEETGQILRLGEWVLGEACRQAATWRRTDGHRILLPVHVNLSARQLSDEALPDVVRAAVLDAGLDPRDLALEITESALMESSEVPARTLAELRSLGVRVLLDDFGTGYSSLSYLREFPIDVLKIDRSFITDLGDREDASAIVGAIVGMGHSLGLEIVAEGIETDQQAREAARLGCDSGQGFLFARPAPSAEVALS